MVMLREDCEGFLKKYISIGIPRYDNSGTLFYYSGWLIEVTNSYIKLKLENGYKQIFLKNLMEIRHCENNNKLEERNKNER